MSIFRKHDDKKDLSKLRQEVVKDEETPTQHDSEKKIVKNKTTIPDIKFDLQKSNTVQPLNFSDQAQQVRSGSGEYAPLFVKVDKYREIVASVREVQSFVSSIKHIFSLLNEAENARNKALDMLKSSVNRLERGISWVDKSLLRPVGFKELPHGELEVRHIEESLSELQRELHSLRREMDQVIE